MTIDDKIKHIRQQIEAKGISLGEANRRMFKNGNYGNFCSRLNAGMIHKNLDDIISKLGNLEEGSNE